MEPAILISLVSVSGTLLLGLLQILGNRNQARKADAEAKAIITKAEAEEKMNEFTILKDLNKELRMYIEDLKTENKTLEEENRGVRYELSKYKKEKEI